MKYVFFGTPRFAEIVLDGLIHAGMPPIALVCNPDRPVGRKKIITPPATKQRVIDFEAKIKNASIEIFQPEKLDDIFIGQMKTLDADFFVVAAYSKILPKMVLELPRLGTLGVHPSLLPLYRGASPIQSAILHGEKETGTTIYLMDEKADHGPVLIERKLIGAEGDSIFELPYLDLEEKLAKLGIKLLLEAIPGYITNRLEPQIQDESRATYTKKFTTEDGFVAHEDLQMAKHDNPEKALEILKKINALNPEPGAWTIKDGKRIKLLAAEVKDGALVLKKTQEEGQKAREV